jgi:hypothetical protein
MQGFLVFIAVAALYAAATYYNSRKPAPPKGFRAKLPTRRDHKDLPPAPQGPQGEVPGLARLREQDKSFDPERFLSRARVVFSSINGGFKERDEAVVGAYLSDGQGEARKITRELEGQAGLRYERNTVELQDPEIRWVASDRHFDAVYVAFRGRSRLSLIDASKGSPLTDGQMRDFAEIWTFVRRPGRQSLQRPGLIEGSCPNCGKPIELADAARCASCGSWINSGEYDWVLTQAARASDPAGWEPSEDWNQDRGLVLLGGADPELNPHFLLDRALIAFWRWQLTRWLKDSGPLRGIGTQGLLAGDLHFGPSDLHVIFDELRFESYEAREGFDRVSFRARWHKSDVTARATDDPAQGWQADSASLTLIRKQGALTKAGTGLSSTHCPDCGAPPTRRDLEACEYCSAPFNDGARQWVLDDVEHGMV